MERMEYPKFTKAAILTELRKPLIIAEIEIPQELKVGQVLVKIHFSGICGSQLGEIDGAKGEDKFLPHLLGHEGSGTVVAIGPGVKTVSLDDKVVLHWRKGDGIESEPPIYNWKETKVNAGWVTTFNEFAIVSENRITTIPKDSEMDVAALFGCAVTTGFGIIENNAKLKIGESVVVFGAGGIGLNVVQAASLVSAYPIIAIDIFDNRLTLAQEMGATHLINSRDKSVEEISELIHSFTKVDVFIDNTGNPQIIELGYNILKPQGKMVLVGVPKKGNNINIFSLPMHFGKSIIGSHGGETVPQIDIPRINNLYLEKRIKLKNLISKTYSLNEINTAISDIRNGLVSGRVSIKF
jgi:S-(hydroxymethyl)glutathione dehydrogenase/alcohol dehydrogenase